MRKWIAITGTFCFLTLTGAASAQQFSSGIGSPATGSFSTTTSTPSFFAQTMARPNMSAMTGSRPTLPTPLNLFNLVPSLPNLQNTLSLRNVFGQQSGYVLPKQATPPPKKK